MIIFNKLLQKISQIKQYYPFFLASDYTPLTYSPYYGQKAAHLSIDFPNKHQVYYTYLNKFLASQIQQDKTLFAKQKQFLFIGRSNSGKSSLINKIFKSQNKPQLKKIARTSKSQGTTKFLHFHHIKNMQSFVVDGPGYGFSRMNKKRRQLWLGLVDEYLKISSRLSQIFVCINLQHGVKKNDIQFLRRCDKYNIDVQIIFTKTDKVNPHKYFYHLQACVQTIKKLELKNINQRMIAVSAKNGFGIQIMRMRLIEAIQNSRQRNIDNKQDLLLSYVKDLRVQRTGIEDKQKNQSKQFLLRKLIYNSKLSKYIK